MQVLCGLQVVFFLFNCQTPEFLKLEENGKAFRKSITSSGSVTHTNEGVVGK